MTPLLEPRYFLIPYVLLRAQIVDDDNSATDGSADANPEWLGKNWSEWLVWIEGGWYMLINGITMYIFLYKERDGVGRFMW